MRSMLSGREGPGTRYTTDGARSHARAEPGTYRGLPRWYAGSPVAGLTLGRCSVMDNAS